MRNPRKPSHAPRLRDTVRIALIDLIVTGALKGGEKLNENELSARLKTSRTPLREALLHLEREGLVRSDQRRGFSVESLTAEEVRETYPLLCALECHAVRQSAAVLPSLIPTLEKLNTDFARAASPKQALTLDGRWHDTLMSGSTNARLKTMVARLRFAIARYEHIYMADKNLTAVSARQHAGIAAALKRSDIEDALRRLEENYRSGMEILLAKMARSSAAGLR